MVGDVADLLLLLVLAMASLRPILHCIVRYSWAAAHLHIVWVCNRLEGLSRVGLEVELS